MFGDDGDDGGGDPRSLRVLFIPVGGEPRVELVSTNVEVQRTQLEALLGGPLVDGVMISSGAHLRARERWELWMYDQGPEEGVGPSARLLNGTTLFGDILLMKTSDGELVDLSTKEIGLLLGVVTSAQKNAGVRPQRSRARISSGDIRTITVIPGEAPEVRYVSNADAEVLNKALFDAPVFTTLRKDDETYIFACSGPDGPPPGPHWQRDDQDPPNIAIGAERGGHSGAGPDNIHILYGVVVIVKSNNLGLNRIDLIDFTDDEIEHWVSRIQHISRGRPDGYLNDY